MGHRGLLDPDEMANLNEIASGPDGSDKTTEVPDGPLRYW